jgi:pimeloyl-ACP methyl ester carboxylesterase
VLADPAPRQFAVVSEIFTAGDPPPALPPVPKLVVWGAEDRLPGTSVRSGRRLARSLGAELVVIPDAGHLPQVEHPEQVARAVVAFGRTPPSAPG